LVDIGTQYVASSLGLSIANASQSLTFGIPTSMERVHAFRSEEEWQTAVNAQNMDITFHG